MQYRFSKYQTLAAMLCLLAALTGCLGNGAGGNTAPVANAGAIQNVTTGTLVTLDGSASSDADGNTLTYNWILTSTPTGSAAVLANATTAAPTFTADKDGTYVVTLVVNDGTVDSTAATVTITAATGNSAPVANAGAAQNVNTGATVTLDGSASSDANGDTLTYNWTLTTVPSGSSAALANATTAAPTFTADKDGAYVATLIVNDGNVDSVAATVTIIAATANSAPVANAGVAQNVSTGATVTLNGSASSDANGDTLTYKWSLIYKPSGSSAALNSTTTPSPSFTADVDGGYVFALVVNDGKVDSVAANVTVTAATANAAPVANAGSAQNVTAGTIVTLNGSASSDADGDTLTYKWALTSKPASSSAALSSSSSVAPTLTTDRAGTYVVALIVNDGKVDSAASTVTITAATANVAPIANAGTAQYVTTGTTVTLDGSTSSDANGDALTYKWTMIYRPSGSSAALNSTTTPTPTFTADVDGGYVFALIVNDGKVDGAVANVTITAATGNVAPVANAGTAQNVTTGTTVTLDGSASSDANGDVLTYNWTLVYKPAGSNATLAGATTAAPTFTADQIGTYVATLTVNDGLANSTTAIVTIASSSSNIAPVANGGSALTRAVGMPITLNGSASSDANGDTLTYSWNLIALPVGSTAILAGATTPTPSFTPDLTGTYVASLVVNDGLVNSVTAATVNITVITRFSAVTGGCVLDNSTGLTWEVKTTDGGLRDWSKTYTNFSATYDPVGQYGASTDASGFAADVNATSLCGYSDWRVPTSGELRSIVENAVSPSIDATWFPNTQATDYWSSSPLNTNTAYGLNFLDGTDFLSTRQSSFYMRLVR